jgi:hypothetical protein
MLRCVTACSEQCCCSTCTLTITDRAVTDSSVTDLAVTIATVCVRWYPIFQAAMHTVVQAAVSSVSLTVDNWAAVRSLMTQAQGYMRRLFNLFYPDTSIIDGLQHLKQYTPVRGCEPRTVAVDKHILELSEVS